MNEIMKRAKASVDSVKRTPFAVAAAAIPVTNGIDMAPGGPGPVKNSVLILADTEGQGDKSAECEYTVYGGSSPPALHYIETC